LDFGRAFVEGINYTESFIGDNYFGIKISPTAEENMATMESTVYISIENSGVRNSIAIISINFVGNKVIPLRY
jgi:hypothetical protein